MTKRRLRTSPARTGLFTPRKVGIVFLVAAGLWVGSSFAQKLVVAYRLNSEVQALQRDNAQVAQANDGYRQQLAALSKPGGAEEAARLHNYVKPDEKVYLIAAPSPTPKPSPKAPTSSAANTTKPSWWQGIWHALTGK